MRNFTDLMKYKDKHGMIRFLLPKEYIVGKDTILKLLVSACPDTSIYTLNKLLDKFMETEKIQELVRCENCKKFIADGIFRMCKRTGKEIDTKGCWCDGVATGFCSWSKQVKTGKLILKDND